MALCRYFFLFRASWSIFGCYLFTAGPPCGSGKICDIAAEPLQQVEPQRQISAEKWKGRNGDWSSSLNSDAATSTPAPFPPYQPCRALLLIKSAASQTPAEMDYIAVSIISRSLPSFLWLSHSVAQSPAGYLFVMGFSHLSQSSPSLQPQSLSM